MVPKFLSERLIPDNNYEIIKANWATDEDLLRICHRDYINFTKAYYRAVNLGLAEEGDFFQYHSLDNRPIGRPGKVEEAARLVIGQAKLAADLVQAGKFKKAVSIGGGLHHAKAASGEGFCLYNDVAILRAESPKLVKKTSAGGSDSTDSTSQAVATSRAFTFSTSLPYATPILMRPLTRLSGNA